ncbi:hypothetical protein VKT23_012929 [Stygiomarasmius scandens]|uniref:Uncharacterized protein n=1 Tax=Marasmiellus scandens TaxID=2682957 RepID=A0ABR1J5E8_9AGAR
MTMTRLLALTTLATILTVSAYTSEPSSFNPFPFSPGFDIQSVATLAEQLPSHSWEFGTASEVLLELYNPSLSVFGDNPFPDYIADYTTIKSLAYAKSKIQLNLNDDAGANVLSNGDGATGDPASLGVSAFLLGKSGDQQYAEGATKTMGYLVGSAPRWQNGAISQRADVAELWADFMYMAPPFLAYYAAATSNTTLLREAVDQCSHYHDVLSTASSSSPAPTPFNPALTGLWHHIIGPQSTDFGLWSTGNGWSIGGITRVLATILKAPSSVTQGWKDSAVSTLHSILKEMLDAATLHPESTLDTDYTGPGAGLLRNYLDDTNSSAHGFGEVSGSAHIAGAIYRLAILSPDLFTPSIHESPYLSFAESIRHLLGTSDLNGNPHVTTQNGTVTPTVDPLCWQCAEPFTAGSPEGQSFVVGMYAAWRDCVWAGVCVED